MSKSERIENWANENSTKLKILYIVWCVLLILVTVAFVLGVFEGVQIHFNADDVPIGLMDTPEPYCEVLLSNGKCVFQRDWVYVNSINFWSECSDGYNEAYNPFYGRYCKVDTSDRMVTHDILCTGYGGDCYSIGMTKNNDTSIPIGYIPDDVLQEISDSALDISVSARDSVP